MPVCGYDGHSVAEGIAVNLNTLAVELFVLLLLLGCSESDRHGHPKLTTGKDFYNAHCAACHHESGKGTFLKGVPPVKYSSLGRSQLANLVTGHSRSDDSRMPVFNEMPRSEALAIADYILQQLKEH